MPFPCALAPPPPMAHFHFAIDFGKVENRKFGGFPPGSPEHAEIDVTKVALLQDGSQRASFPKEAKTGVLKDERHIRFYMQFQNADKPEEKFVRRLQLQTVSIAEARSIDPKDLEGVITP